MDITISSIYLMRSDNGKGSHLYKIGIAKNPELRLKKLQNGNPQKIILMCSKEVPNAEELEARLHKAFRSKRIRKGEWFQFDGKSMFYLFGLFWMIMDWNVHLFPDILNPILKRIEDSVCGQLRLYPEEWQKKIQGIPLGTMINMICDYT